jgi:hypothetical protein
MEFHEMNPGVHKTDGHCERRALGLPDTEATPSAHHNRGADDPCADVPGSGSERYGDHWDSGFAGEGDPYGISEYTSQSANPDAALPNSAPALSVVTTPTDFALYKGTVLLGSFPTLADAEAAKTIAEAH